MSTSYVCCRYPDGTVRLRNPNIQLRDEDILYHLALGSSSNDLASMFGDVKVKGSQLHAINQMRTACLVVTNM
jgi:hypothetical protein